MEAILLMGLTGLSGLAFWWRSHYFSAPISNDLGTFLYYAEFYRPDLKKYSEFYLSPYNSGFHRLCRLVYRAGFNRPCYIAILGCLVSLATAWLIYLIARLLFGYEAAFLAAAAYLYCTSLPYLTHRWDWIEIYNNFFFCLSVLGVLAALAFPGWQLFLLPLAGISCGLAICFKLSAGPFFLGTLSFLVISVWQGAVSWSGMLSFLGGACLPFCVQMVEIIHAEGKPYFFWWIGAWRNLFQWKKADVAAPSVKPEVTSRKIFYTVGFPLLMQCLVPVWLAGGFLLAGAGREQAWAWLLLVWLVSETLVTLAIHRVGWLHHFYTLLPPVCLMAGKAAGDLGGYLGGTGLPLSPAGGLMLAALLVTAGLALRSIREYRHYFPSRYFQKEDENLFEKVTTVVQQHTGPEDYIFQWGEHFHIHVRSHRPCPTNLGFTFCFQPNIELQLPHWRHYLLDAFLKRPPKILFIMPGLAGQFPFELLERLANLRYAPLGQLLVDDTPVIYRRVQAPPTEFWETWRRDNTLTVGDWSVDCLIKFLTKYMDSRAGQGQLTAQDLWILQELAGGHPDLGACYRRLKSLQEQAMDISVFAARNGEYTGTLTVAERQISLHSTYNPGREAEMLVEAAISGGDHDLVILGAGLGHHVNSALRRQNPGRLMYLVEESPKLFAACIDLNGWEDLRNNGRLIPLVGKPVAEVVGVLEQAGVMQEPWIEHRPSISLDPDYYRELKEKRGHPATPALKG
jgi:hypothetical protein